MTKHYVDGVDIAKQFAIMVSDRNKLFSSTCKVSFAGSSGWLYLQTRVNRNPALWNQRDQYARGSSSYEMWGGPIL